MLKIINLLAAAITLDSIARWLYEDNRTKN